MFDIIIAFLFICFLCTFAFMLSVVLIKITLVCIELIKERRDHNAKTRKP